MKVGIYTPYLDSFGGGERYVLTVAEILSSAHQVDLLLDPHHLTLDPTSLKNKLGEHLNLDLSKVFLSEAPLGENGNLIQKLLFLKNYDLLFYVTDGSIFYSTAKKNLIHFQVPFKNTTAKSLWGKIKLSSWHIAVCNSKFTERFIKSEWPVKTCVLYPPVEVEKLKALKKKKQILTVGRFNSFLKPKKHEEMIQAFKKLVDKKLSGWSFVLAGSVEGDEEYINELRELAKGYPIEFYPHCPFNQLIKLYGESSLYWHAMGFGEDDPTKMEHFGITTVEAMAAGCVPIVIDKGGQPEIVEDKKSGFLWNTLEELENLTLQLTRDPKQLAQLSENAISRSKLFSKNNFLKELERIIESL